MRWRRPACVAVQTFRSKWVERFEEPGRRGHAEGKERGSDGVETATELVDPNVSLSAVAGLPEGDALTRDQEGCVRRVEGFSSVGPGGWSGR
jgi:hypothetical protein